MKKKFNLGFTLIEVLVAVFILALAGGAAILVENQSLKSGSINKHKLQANALAQEGTELVRALRDKNLFNNYHYDTPALEVDVFEGLEPGIYAINTDASGTPVFNAEGSPLIKVCELSVGVNNCTDDSNPATPKNPFEIKEDGKTFTRKIVIE